MKKQTLIVNKLNSGTSEILVYGYIDSEMATEFAKQIKLLEVSCSVINVRINSVGGSVYDGIAMFNCVLSAKCAIDMYIDGIAASMASALAMAGRKVYMSRFARLMTHKPSAYGGGTSEELRAVADEIDALEPILNEFYCRKTGLTTEEVYAKFLNGKDNYFGADAAKTAKLVDDIYDGVAVDMPVTADITTVYEAFQTKFTASLQDIPLTNNKSAIMKEIKIPLSVWGQICASSGISDAADDAQISAELTKIVAKAKRVDKAEADKKTAEDALADFKSDAIKTEVTDLLEAAHKGQKITAQQKTHLGEKYADDPKGLKAMLATMGFTSINSILKQEDKQGGVYPAEVTALMEQGWDKLMSSGAMAKLKGLSAEAYAEMYEARYPQSAKPSGKNRNGR